MKEASGKLPDVVVSGVGGGLFDIIPDKSVQLVGVQAGGEGECSKLAVETCRSESIARS